PQPPRRAPARRRGHAPADRGGARRPPRHRRGRARRIVLVVHPGVGRRPLLPRHDQGGQAMIELLDPPVEAAKQPIAYVDRPGTLKGKRIGLIENTKYNSDKLLLKIGEILKSE